MSVSFISRGVEVVGPFFRNFCEVSRGFIKDKTDACEVHLGGSQTQLPGVIQETATGCQGSLTALEDSAPVCDAKND